MECICRDLGRQFRFQQERYSPCYYVLPLMDALSVRGLSRDDSEPDLGLDAGQPVVPVLRGKRI